MVEMLGRVEVSMQISVFFHSFTEQTLSICCLYAKPSLSPRDTVVNKPSSCFHGASILVNSGQINVFLEVLGASGRNREGGGSGEGWWERKVFIFLCLSRDLVDSEEEPFDPLGRELLGKETVHKPWRRVCVCGSRRFQAWLELNEAKRNLPAC